DRHRRIVALARHRAGDRHRNDHGPHVLVPRRMSKWGRLLGGDCASLCPLQEGGRCREAAAISSLPSESEGMGWRSRPPADRFAVDFPLSGGGEARVMLSRGSNIEME